MVEYTYDDPGFKGPYAHLTLLIILIHFPVWTGFLYVAQITARREGRSFWTGPRDRPARSRYADVIGATVIAGIACGLYGCVSGVFPSNPVETTPHLRDILEGQIVAIFLSPVRAIKLELAFCAVFPAILRKFTRTSTFGWCAVILICAAARAAPFRETHGLSLREIFVQSVPIGIVLILLARRHGAVAAIAAGLLARLLTFTLHLY